MMHEWKKRPPEVKYLLNPAFCGRILSVVITEYECKSGNAMPFPLLYLVLPIVLHKKTRDKMPRNSRKKLLNWVSENQDILARFAARVSGMVEITNESIEFLLSSGLVQLTKEGKLIKNPERTKLSETQYINDEIRDCISKAKIVAKWFADAGTAENIYVCLGVRP